MDRNVIKERKIEEFGKTYEDVAKKIKPTKFDLFYDESVNEISLSDKRKNIEFVFKTISIKEDKFVKRAKRLSTILIDLGYIPSILVNYIETLMEYNSNVVSFSVNSAASILNVSEISIKRGIKCLCDNNIIARTTNRGEYVINHNLLFMGKLKEFFTNYNVLYDGRCAQVDINGKIILNKLLDDNNYVES